MRVLRSVDRAVDRRREEGHTFARFLRHSVQALGVTTPRPLRLLDDEVADTVGSGALGVPVDVDEDSGCVGVAAAGVGRGRGRGRGVPLDGVDAEAAVGWEEGLLDGGDRWASRAGESSSMESMSEDFLLGGGGDGAGDAGGRGGRGDGGQQEAQAQAHAQARRAVEARGDANQRRGAVSQPMIDNPGGRIGRGNAMVEIAKGSGSVSWKPSWGREKLQAEVSRLGRCERRQARFCSAWKKVACGQARSVLCQVYQYPGYLVDMHLPQTSLLAVFLTSMP